MRTIHILAYDDFIEGTTPVYTQPEFNTQLSMPDKLKLVAVVDSVTGTTPTLLVQLEESGDERNWINKTGTAEIIATTISLTAVTVLAGFDNGGTPSSGFIRARLVVGGTGTLKAKVKLWITGRGEVGGG